MSIVLNGVSIDELKKQKALIQKDASKFIADSTAQVQLLVAQIVGEEDDTVVQSLSQQALGLLENIQVVSGVSGVEYFFKYGEDYGNYSNSEIMSCQLEDLCDFDGDYRTYSKLPLYQLQGMLEEMESNVCTWNSSTC